MLLTLICTTAKGISPATYCACSSGGVLAAAMRHLYVALALAMLLLILVIVDLLYLIKRCNERKRRLDRIKKRGENRRCTDK